MVQLNQFLLKLAVGILAVINGGTGTSTPPTAGQVLIGKSDGTYTPADLTAGSNVTITKGNGSVTIASSGGGGGGLGDPGSNGVVVRTALNTTTARSLTAPAAGFTISNNTGVSGNPTFALSDDLAGLEALASTGLVARTSSNTYANRSITAGSSKISISNGDGVSGNPSIDATEANFTLSNIGGSVTDAQVPNTITLDNLTQITTRDHGSLTGLSDDDHSIYALLAGRSGGQTLKGGSGSGENLTLKSTSHATLGGVILDDWTFTSDGSGNGVATLAGNQSFNAGGVVVLNGNYTVSSPFYIYNSKFGSPFTPAYSIDVSDKTDAVAIPKGTTLQRPTAIDGLIRYNTDTSKFEAREAGAWVDMIGGGGSGLTHPQVMARVSYGY